MKYILYLSGYLKSGKDTVGDYLVKIYNFTRFAFADSLKDEVSKLYGISRSLLDTQEGKESWYNKDLTVRDILIKHGNQMREQDKNYWVKQVQVSILSSGVDRAVVTDFRFPNEIQPLDGFQNFSWRVNRWDIPPLVSETETSLDDYPFDLTLSNKDSKDQLYRLIDDSMYKSDMVRFFLVDIDDVSLNWIDSFKQAHRGYQFEPEYPTTWLLQGWIFQNGEPISQEKVLELISSFNHSLHFQSLPSYPGALEMLERIKSLDYHIIAITSCTSDPIVEAYRHQNIEKEFPNLISRVICLPLGMSKKETLGRFKKSFFLDDNTQHVRDALELGHQAYLMTRPWNASDRIIHRIHDFKDLETVVR